MNIIEKLIKEKDELITVHHQKKDVSALKTTLSQLEDEDRHTKEDLNAVNYLLDLIEKHNIDELDNLKDEFIKHEHISKWLEKTKIVFEKLHLKNSDELNTSEKEFIRTEKTKLLKEHKRLEKQLSYLNKIIAKTKFLVADLKNSLSTDLTNGDNISAIGKKLIEKFGTKTTSTYTYTIGRKEIIKFLEETYSINGIKSKTLFDLLEDSKVVEFEVDNTNLNFSNYYNDDIGLGSDWVPLFGSWIFNSK